MCIESYDDSEAQKYDSWIKTLTDADHMACLQDIQNHVALLPGNKILDAGAGSGALCLALSRVSDIQITALEPCPAMISLFRNRSELADVKVVEGFCDHHSDVKHFDSATFDFIASRQLTNTLFDPLAAFQNWKHWLQPEGKLVVIDGLYDRDAWTGKWSWAVDQLPLSACRSRATVPYLLEQVGFMIEYAGPAVETNKLASTRTERYLVVAANTKP